MKKIVIIGAGLGGLSAAITLQHAGYQVTVIEKNEHAGGKLHPVKVGEASFDFGPNTITMPHIFNEVIEQTGESPLDYMEFLPLESHTTNAFKDGSSFRFSSNHEILKEELATMRAGEADKVDDYLQEVKRLYELSERYFLRRTFSSWRDYLSAPLAKAMIKSRPLESLDHFHRRYFKDERVIAAFNRYATYIGSSPFSSPATFGMIGHLELTQGVFYTKGGNVQIATGFKRLAEKLGVLFHFSEEVKQIHVVKSRASRVETTKGSYLADLVILNGDLLTQVPKLISEKSRPSLKDKNFASYEPSISAYVIMAETDKRFPLNHHHVFFGDDPKKEFSSIFDHNQYGKDPTMYICTSSKTEPSRSRRGDNLFILANAPALQNKMTQQVPSPAFFYERLEEFGLQVKPHILDSTEVTPAKISHSFNAFYGALYGISSNKRKDTFLRPYNKSTDIDNLYFVGGSTHPGGGSPMVTLSGMNVAKQVIRTVGN
ncbi:phytoene desaturase [Paenalkalicoccus suaedae]|uniref:Phytoene desaturase n=1 Tax=Paenalkalicoccus suaedae TaxID=2592382 RepID=A0A859FCQ0_9BACI|nr:phytoene desaturase family protein [Paenalkalicoccus suaedae]QKS71009.1 phytoene desaturase [Paenalkalicoccus suaedae]